MKRVELELEQESNSVFTPLGLKCPCESKKRGCEISSLVPSHGTYHKIALLQISGDQLKKNHEQIFENFGKNSIFYDAHMRVKIKVIMYKVNRDLEKSDFHFLQNVCKLRYTQIQMNNALAYENNRLAGCMLTGNC